MLCDRIEEEIADIAFNLDIENCNKKLNQKYINGLNYELNLNKCVDLNQIYQNKINKVYESNAKTLAFIKLNFAGSSILILIFMHYHILETKEYKRSLFRSVLL